VDQEADFRVISGINPPLIVSKIRDENIDRHIRPEREFEVLIAPQLKNVGEFMVGGKVTASQMYRNDVLLTALQSPELSGRLLFSSWSSCKLSLCIPLPPNLAERNLQVGSYRHDKNSDWCVNLVWKIYHVSI
jgi:hypothetical protein